MNRLSFTLAAVLGACLTLGVIQQAQARQEPNPQRFEYTTMRPGFTSSWSDDLNKKAKAGWRYIGEVGSTGNRELVFERPVPSP